MENTDPFENACQSIQAFQENSKLPLQESFPFWETIILKSYKISLSPEVLDLFKACRQEAENPPNSGLCTISPWEAFVSYFDQEFAE